MSARATWVLLVPADAAWVRERAGAEWQERYADMEDIVPPWEVRPGTGGYTALVDVRPGSEGTEEALAEQWSAELGKPVYGLRLREDLKAVFRYEAGTRVEWMPEDTGGLARRLGCELEEAP